ncbi:MAG: pilin [Candidatus Gracilibacteria bacterium]|nr:pilin [Candidatus Gracilibacteria bacterium]
MKKRIFISTFILFLLLNPVLTLADNSTYCALFLDAASCDPISCNWNGSCTSKGGLAVPGGEEKPVTSILTEDLAPQPSGGFFAGFFGQEKDDAYGQIASTDSLVSLLSFILNFSLGLVGIIMLLYLVYGGYLWMFAMGEEGQVEKAKKIIFYNTVGFIVIISSWAIVNTLLGINNIASLKLRFGVFDSLPF